MDFASTSFYIEGGKRFPTIWLDPLHVDGQYILPSYSAIGWKEEPWMIALGYVSSYDDESSALAEVTTPSHPEWTGEYTQIHDVARIHTVFGALSHPLGENIRFGITAGINYLYYRSTNGDLGLSGNAFGAMTKIGILAEPFPEMSIGGTFSVWSRLGFDGAYLAEVYHWTADVPWSAEIGSTCRLSPDVQMMIGVDVRGWSSVHSGLGTELQFHAGCEYDIRSDLTLRCGLFTGNSIVRTFAEHLNETFLTAGCNWTISDAMFVTGTLIDSHLLSTSTEYRTGTGHFRQTIISLGAGYRW
jgi:hypothetical protein